MPRLRPAAVPRFAVVDGRAQWNGRTLAEAVPLLVDSIVRAVDPALVILFGSVAAGDDGPDSDVDLLVVVDEAPVHQRRELMSELRRLTRAVGVPRDILVTSAADFEARRDTIGTMEYEPAQHGLIVHERVRAA